MCSPDRRNDQTHSDTFGEPQIATQRRSVGGIDGPVTVVTSLHYRVFGRGNGCRESVPVTTFNLCFTASVTGMRFNEKELVSLSRQPSEKAAELGMRGPKKGDGNTVYYGPTRLLSHRTTSVSCRAAAAAHVRISSHQRYLMSHIRTVCLCCEASSQFPFVILQL